MKNMKITVETAQIVYKVGSQVKHPDLERGGAKTQENSVHEAIDGNGIVSER